METSVTGYVLRMTKSSMVDQALDRSVALGYGNVGILVRKRLASWPADPPLMEGKVVLITGAASGLGLAAAVGFARLGASVRAVARDDDRAGEAVEMVRDRLRAVGAVASVSSGRGDVRPVACDVADRASVRAFVQRFSEQEDRLDVLVNNAGVMPDERTRTSDGIELTFATQVLAPWMLIDGLRPLLEAAAPSRVINVTSGGQYGQKVPIDDLESDDTRYGPKKIYARTKREMLAVTEMWAERLTGSDVHVHAMHPGWADTKGVRNWMPIFRALTRPVMRTPEQGADTIVWLGGAPETVQSTGRFWHDRQQRPTTYRVGAGGDTPAARQQLWARLATLAADTPRPA